MRFPVPNCTECPIKYTQGFVVLTTKAGVIISWWRHQMETPSALLALSAGNSPVTGEFPPQRPVTRRFDVLFDLRLNKRLSKQLWGWWFVLYFKFPAVDNLKHVFAEQRSFYKMTDEIWLKSQSMMTSSNENIFHVTGPLCGEFTGNRWIPLTKASDAELWCFLWSAPKTNSWTNSRDAGDFRRHHAHYDVTVMAMEFYGGDIVTPII